MSNSSFSIHPSSFLPVAPDGVEPSFPGCRPGVVAVGPRGCVYSEWSHRESHPDLQCAILTSSCWTMTPTALFSGSRGTRTHKRFSTATCFQDRLLIRPDGFRCCASKAAGVGIEPTSRRPERLVLPLDDPASICPSRHRSISASSGRRVRTFVAWFKARKPTTSRSPITFQSALRELNPPRQVGSLAPLPLGQGHARRKERESNPQGCEARPASNGVPSPVGLPFRSQAPAGGIEPPSPA